MRIFEKFWEMVALSNAQVEIVKRCEK